MRVILTILLLFCSSLSFGQWNWPVQTNTFMEPFANNYLSYFSDQNNHLQILVTLTDQNATAVPAKLKIRMEGNGWWIETKQEPNSIPPLELEPFVSNIITGIDLQPYFFESNLNKSDASLDLNNLPEGQVELCVEVYGIGGTLTTIGGNQCTYFNIERLQPPQFFPMACGTTLDTNLMFHTFQWTPATGFSPLIGAEIEYTFSLYEVVDPNNYAIQVSNQIGLIHQEVTPFQTIQINLFDLNLQVGKKYIWQVRAIVYDNGVPRQMVDNDGFSGICEFHFGEAQSLEESLVDGLEIVLNAQANTQYKGTASWTVTDNTPNTGLSTYERYFVEYRLQPDAQHPNPTWHYDTVIALNKLIYQLAPESTYEVRVSGMAGSFTSDPTPIVSFTTPAAIDYVCGDEQIPFRPSQFTPNENIRVGDQVQIGQFLMNITEAIPQYEPGRYGGQGWIPVEFLGGARANVIFENILIDNEYVVRDGRVDVTTDGVDAWLDDQMQNFIDPIYVNGTVDSAWVDTTTNTAWVVVDGETIPFTFDPPDYPIVIHDDSGMSWTIWPNGTITVEGYLDPSNDYLDVSADSVAIFAQNDSEVYGFDAKEHMAWHENYEIIQLPDSTYYFVANKSIGKDASDVVDVTIPVSGTPVFKLDDQFTLSFSPSGGGAGGGSTQSSSQNGTTYTVNIPAISSQGRHEIYVYNDVNQRVGKLNVHVYKQKNRELTVVPVASTSIDATQLKAQLDETLKEANLEISVTVAPQWNDTLFTPTKTIALPEDLSLMTNYSEDMRKLRDAYFDDSSNAKNSNAYYLFVVPQFDDPNADGYMVKGKALGFVTGNDYQVYAHELAHGMGGLDHTWKWNGPDQGTTDNLMDYASGNNVNLTKAQWKELRDVDVIPSLWDESEDYLSLITAAKFDNDSLNASQPSHPTDPYNVDVPITNFTEEAVFRAPNGMFFRINQSVRESIDFVRFSDGAVSDLLKNTTESTFSGLAYYTKGDVGNEKVTCSIETVVFLNKYAPREISVADNNGSDIALCEGRVSGDFYDFDFPQCHEFDGEYVRGWANNQPVMGSVNCPEDDECDSKDVDFFSDIQKDKVKNAFRSIILDAVASNGDYNPFKFLDGPNFTLDKKDKKVIEDKIQTLNHYRSDIIVGYVAMNGVQNYLFTQETCDSMAKVVVDELKLEFPSKKLILYFNHQITGINQTITSTTGWSCQKSSFAASHSEMIEAGTLSQDLSSFSDAANSFFYLFSKIKKPYYITTIYEKYDGSYTWKVLNKMDDPAQDIHGLPFIFGANHVVSKYKESFEYWENERNLILFSYIGGQLGSAIESLLETELFEDPTYLVSQDSLEAIIALAESHQRLEMPEDWIPGNISFGQVKESCLNAKIALMEYKKLSKSSHFWVDVQLVAGADWGGFSSAIYYEFDVYTKVIDPIIYTSLDVLGCIPGVDILTDAAGLVYASARGDLASAFIYSAALSLPFVGSAYLHGGQKVYNYYAKIGINDVLEYSVKSADEVTDGWIKISNDIPYTNNRKSVIKNELESSVNQFDDNIVRQLVNAQQSGSQITVKYPSENFLEFVQSNFDQTQMTRFNLANSYYSSYNPSFNINELRGIDFDYAVENISKQNGSEMFQLVRIDDNGEPIFGSYFFEDINEDVTKLGIGDLERISSDGRVKVRITLGSNTNFLKSKTANIEDWTGSGQVFEGGGNQYYNPQARNQIVSYEIIEIY
ncbi:MAG: hypothetical protein ACFHU9_05200 [Fluviicola sp.]